MLRLVQALSCQQCFRSSSTCVKLCRLQHFALSAYGLEYWARISFFPACPPPDTASLVSRV